MITGRNLTNNFKDVRIDMMQYYNDICKNTEDRYGQCSKRFSTKRESALKDAHNQIVTDSPKIKKRAY